MKKYILKSLFVFALLFLGSHFVFANQIVSQSVSSDSASISTSSVISQSLGTGFSSVFKTLQLTAKKFGSDDSYFVSLICFTSSSYATPCSGSNSGIVAHKTGLLITDTVKTVYTIDFNTIWNGSSYVSGYYTFDSSKYYKLQIDNINTSSTLYGSNSNVYVNGSLSVDSGTIGSLQDLFFILYDDESLPISAFANSINITSPTYAQNFSSPHVVNFHGLYNYATGFSSNVYDKVGFSVLNANTLTEYSVSPLSIVSDTPTTFDFNLTVSADSAYSFKVFFYNSTDSTVPYFYSDIVPFSDGSGGGLVTSFIQDSPCSIDHLDNCLKNAFYWAFVPSQSVMTPFSDLKTYIMTRFPFSYVGDISTMVTELYSNPSGDDFDISIPFGSSSLQLISASSISAVPFVGTFKTIFSYIIYLLTAYTIYRIVLKAFNTQQNG